MVKIIKFLVCHMYIYLYFINKYYIVVFITLYLLNKLL